MIKLTDEEKQLVKEGKLNPADIMKHREDNPVVEKKVDKSELDEIKQQITETNMLYKDAIQKNKDLYKELEESRKRKEECRNKLAELRQKKKELMGA
jgi:septal ring factor EnvC (AmiA/AmiB activator)